MDLIVDLRFACPMMLVVVEMFLIKVISFVGPLSLR
jgi:hypothetical protein